MKKYFRLKLLLAAAVFSVLSFISCEIGLGEAVDTETPNVTVSYPPESSVIRNTFVVSGTCTDDQGIDKVIVTVQNTDTGVIYGTYNASVEGATWKVTLNNGGSFNGFEYPDGRYTVSAKASDKSGRVSGISSRSFDIDNTAPVLIISKPLATSKETPSPFGKIIKIAGDISEDHVTESLIMHVREYDAETKSLGPQRDVSVSDFTTMSSDTPLVIAQYCTQKEIDEETDPVLKDTMRKLRDKYLTIYGTGIEEKQDVNGDLTGQYSSAGDKQFYASVQLTDNAREYRNPGDNGSGSGNTTSLYYINSSSFYDSLMTENTYNLTATKLKKILNGTDTSYSAEQRNDITRKINTNENNAFYVSSNGVSEYSSVFVVNPENNPTFFVTGYERLYKNNDRASKTNGYRELPSGSTVNLTIESGKDGTSIAPKDVQVIAYRMDTYSDTDIDSKKGTAKEKILVNNPAVPATKWGDENGTDASSSLGKAVQIDDAFFVSGKYYRIVVTGKDTEGVEITKKCSDGYGFQVLALSEPPVVSITSTQDKYFSETAVGTGSGIDVKVEVKPASGVTLIDQTSDGHETYAENLKDHIYVKVNSDDENDGVKVESITDNSWTPTTDGNEKNRKLDIKITKPTGLDSTPAGNTYKFTLHIGGDEASVPKTPGKYRYRLNVGVTDSAGKSSETTFTFYLDNQNPEMALSLSPSVSSGEKTKVNGEVEISGTASDNYELDSVKYWVYTVGDSSSLTKEILVKGGTDGITVSSPSEPSFKIDTTPVAFDPFVLAEDGKTYNKKLKIKAVVKDKTGHTKEVILEDYVIDQITDKPVVNGTNFDKSIKTKDGVSADTGNVFDKNGKLIGSITDDDGLSSAEVKIYKESDLTTPVYTKPLSTENGKIFNDVTLPETPGFYKVVITAKDSKFAEAVNSERKNDTTDGKTAADRIAEVEANRKDEESFWIAVDNKAPELKDEDFELSSVNYIKDDTVTITGKVRDDWKLSDTDGLKIQVKTASDTDYKTVDWVSVSVGSTPDGEGFYTWTGTLNFTGKDQGKYDLKITATDASKRSKSITANFCRDYEGPAFGTGVLPGQSGYNESKVAPYIVESVVNGTVKDPLLFNATSLSVKGTVSDAGKGDSGIQKVEYSIDGGSNWTSLSGTTSFDGTIVDLKNGDTITIKATDNAGNSTSTTLGPVQIDIVSPSAALTGIVQSESINESTQFEPATGTIETNGTISIWVKGTVSDAVPAAQSTSSCESGIASVQFHYGSNAFEQTDEKATISSDKTSWTYKLNNSKIETAFKTLSGNIWARVIDNAGNTSDLPLQVIIYDGQYPEAKIDSVKYLNTETNVDEANGKIKIKGSSSDNQTLKNVKLEYIKKADYDANPLAAWNQYGATETTNLYNWEFVVDTTDSTKFEDNTDYYFRASATDSAGNTGNSKAKIKEGKAYDVSKYKTLKISQDSDRPIITFTTIDLHGMTAANHAWLKKSNTIYYNVYDDDGEVEVKYRNGYEWVNGTTKYYTENEKPAAGDQVYLDSGCATKAYTNPPAPGVPQELKVVSISENKIKVTDDLKDYALSAFVAPTTAGSIVIDDGSYTLLFQITDKKASGFDAEEQITFTSGVKVNDKDHGPKLKDGINSDLEFADNTRLYLNVDKSAPTVQNKTYSVWNSSLETPAYGEPSSSLSTLKFGGVYNKFKIALEAQDDNGVQKVTVKRGSTVVGEVEDTDGSRKNAAVYKWEISDIDVSALSSGTYTYSLIVTDQAGIEKIDTFNVTVDNTPATILIDSHTEGEQVGLAFILKGTVDNSDTDTSVKFYVDKNSTIRKTGSETDATSSIWKDTQKVMSVTKPVASWRINVDGKINADDGETHTKTHKQMFIENYGDAASSGTPYGILINAGGTIVTKASASDTVGTSTRYTTTKPLYFHFLITDSVGNTSVKNFRMNIDPQGDIPTVKMTYPTVGSETATNGTVSYTYAWYSAAVPAEIEAERWKYTNTPGESLSETQQFTCSDGKTYTYTYRGAKTTLSGFIRAMGAAEAKGDATIMGVYMQIDPKYDPVKGFNSAAWEGKGSAVNTVKETIKCPDNTTLSSHLTESNNIEYIYQKYNDAQALPADKKLESTTNNNLYAIYIGKEPSWGYTINKGELDGLDGATNTIAVRLYTVDSTGKLSNVDPMNDLIITIDSEAPKFGSHKPFYLYQYAWVNGSSTIYTDRGPKSLDLGSLENGNTVSVYTESGCRTAASPSTGTYIESATVKKITYNGKDYVPLFRSVKYENNMWLKGEWWLSGSIEDDTHVHLIKEENTNYQIVKKQTTEEAPVYDTAANAKSNGQEKQWDLTKGFIINYRVGSTETNNPGYGEITYKIAATDLKESVTDQKTAIQIFSINYDNKAPEVDESGSFFNMEKIARNDNGFYTVGTAAYENGTQSGFARAVVYFTKDKTTPAGKSEISDAIFDTYIKKNADGNAQTTVGLHEEDNLFWITATISSYENKVITISEAVSKNIHKGGLVKLAGAYYVVDDISGNQITLDKTPAEGLDGYKIYFAIGHVIDHEGQEGKGDGSVTDDEYYGYYRTLASDNDKDHMVEKVSTSGTRTVWSGDINSLNMPDGPVKLVYVVFDQAGNTNKKELDVIVGNNAPRLASVRIWSDYNGNNSEDSEESNIYYYAEVPRQLEENKAKVSKSIELTSTLVVCNPDNNNNKNAPIPGVSASGKAFMTVKDTVTLVPEVVGGNGDLYYSYMAGTAAQFKAAYNTQSREYKYDTFKTGKTENVHFGRNNTRFGTGHDDYIDTTADKNGYYRTDLNGDVYMQGHTRTTDNDADTEYKIQYTGSQMASLGNSTSDDDPTWFEFTIWDSAEGSTKWTNALSAKIQVALNVMYNDSKAPVVNVNRFFHEKAGCDTQGKPLNSLYKGNKANGHIELEGELSGIAAGTTALKAVTSTLQTLDEVNPKVSGKITIRGTAYDDIRLNELYVKFPGHSNGTIGSALTKVASYNKDATHLGWTSESPDTDANMSAKGWTFTVTDRYNNAAGHLVDWEFNVDTSFLSAKAAKGVGFQFQAKDKRGNSGNGNTSGLTDVTASSDVDKYNRPGYTMDVVPYITKVVTSLSGYNKANPSIYDRTSLGHYPVYKSSVGFKAGTGSTRVRDGIDDETVRIYGFNLTDATVDTENGGSYITITPVKGKYTAISNNIPSLNNINNNEAKGKKKDGTAAVASLSQTNYATYAYNRQPNGANNNLLTDDVEFDVWDVNRKAARASNNMVLDASMKINPKNGIIGFAFNNGDYYWSMPGTNNSYQKYWTEQKDFTRMSSFAYDAAGYTYGAVLGGESGATSGDQYAFYTSRWTGTTKRLGIESNMQKGKKDNTETGTYFLNKDRFLSANYATYIYKDSENKDKVNVYMAYYDQINGEIRYKAGALDTTKDSGATFGAFVTGLGTTYSYSTNNCQVVADDIGTGNLGIGGEYVSIGVTSENVVVMVWYDAKNHNLMYAYNRNGATGTNTSTTPAINNGNNKTGWTGPFTLRNNAGKFCQLAVANDNSIHIATYDSKNADLIYINMSSYTDTNTTKVATVDAYQTTGKQITIDVAQVGDYQIPYIGYWASYPKRARYAYLASPETFYNGTAVSATNTYTGKNGAESNKFTGVWDVSLVPTCSTVYLDENTPWRINVGVWKYNGTAADDGKLAYSTTGTNRGKVTGTNSYMTSTADTDNGTCYGNGTNNGVIGYTINDPAGDSAVTTFETAQKQ